MGSSSHDLGAELRMHSFTVNCDTSSNEENRYERAIILSIDVISPEISALTNQRIYLVIMSPLSRLKQCR